MPGEGKYTIDPETGEITFQPEPEFVGEATPVPVRGYDTNGKSADTTYTPTVNAADPEPTAEPETSEGKQGEPQTGTPEFTEGSKDAPMKSFTLVDPDGKEVTELTVPGEGKYTIDPETGEITFQPEPEFVGKATPVPVRGYDKNGCLLYTSPSPRDRG